MGDLLDIESLSAKAEQERTRVVEALRALATRLEAIPQTKLLNALPIAASGVSDLERRLAPWLR
jgi:hypothetical protein